MLTLLMYSTISLLLLFKLSQALMCSGADPGFDQGGGGPDRDRPKTAILGPQFCRILVLGPHFWWSGGGPRPLGPPLDLPLVLMAEWLLHKTEDLKRTCWLGHESRGGLEKNCLYFHNMNRCYHLLVPIVP